MREYSSLRARIPELNRTELQRLAELESMFHSHTANLQAKAKIAGEYFDPQATHNNPLNAVISQQGPGQPWTGPAWPNRTPSPEPEGSDIKGKGKAR